MGTVLMTTIILTVLILSMLLGLISILGLDRYIDSSNEEMLNTVCKNEADQIDFIFEGMEKSVRIMESLVRDSIDSPEEIKNREKQDEVIKAAEDAFIDVAKHTSGAVAYHMRFAPAISDNTTGLFYSKSKGSDEFVRMTPTDLSLYPEDDTANVGWFWQPYRAGEAVWIMPYYKSALDLMLVSFVTPIYYGDLFVGVVGIDFDYAELTDMVDGIKMHEHGFAFLTHDGHIAYHKDFDVRTEVPNYSEDYSQTSHKLRNGMTLVVLAHNDDVYEARAQTEIKIILVVFAVTVLVVIVTVAIINGLTNPLRQLMRSVNKVADDNFDIELVPSKIREISQLSADFKEMAVRLEEHHKNQHLLAYRDALTGLRNATSYKAWVNDFEKKLGESVSMFGVAVFDINYLKNTNDIYGHNVGNKLIIAAARTISYVFKRSPVFRIGGDEFVVILQGYDLRDREELLEKLDARSKEEFIIAGNEKIPISIAAGVALYNMETDTEFSSVFHRADAKMYENKKEMKAKTTV